MIDEYVARLKLDWNIVTSGLPKTGRTKQKENEVILAAIRLATLVPLSAAVYTAFKALPYLASTAGVVGIASSVATYVLFVHDPFVFARNITNQYNAPVSAFVRSVFNSAVNNVKGEKESQDQKNEYEAREFTNGTLLQPLYIKFHHLWLERVKNMFFNQSILDGKLFQSALKIITAE